MSELLPTLQADDIRSGLVDFIGTTFALADDAARESLERFLVDPSNGIFKGPYVRARVPFRPADTGWRDALEWYEGFTPYGHQAAAFARLSSANLGDKKANPLPTLVTTGTGSGKTESFLYPILDHVLREKRNGQGGIKALILYPMNALANDQARRIASLIAEQPALGGIRAAIYTGQQGPKRTTVTAEGLITDRATMRADAPDILLTNYKMLDQLLLRSADQPLWEQSAASLQYLVLDEFHTYDGAQGTDVAMLLRRLRLVIGRFGGDPAAITPVATSATLGDKGDPTSMISFANTVFGKVFDETSVVTETRQSIEEWTGGAEAAVAAAGYEAQTVDNLLVDAVNHRVDTLGEGGRDATAITAAVLGALYGRDVADGETELLLALAKAHPLVQAIAQAAPDAIPLADLADALLPAGLSATESYESRAVARNAFIISVIAALSHVRALAGREALSIDLHLWMRALTRIDRAATSDVSYSWSDDGEWATPDAVETPAHWFPAIYCRHCGRSGWGVELAPTGLTLALDDAEIRRNHASKANSRFRALLYAPTEAAKSATDGERIDGLHWLEVQERVLLGERPEPDETREDAPALPVLALSGEDVGDRSNDDVCPSCQRVDGIRFLGSAVATMLSVAVTTVFADAHLEAAEKKALVFTDSVQDAAHRAGFVQSRSHVFSLRNAIRSAVDRPMSLDTVVEELIRRAESVSERYRLLSPDIVARDEFRKFWETGDARKVPTSTLRRVRDRLLLDVELEFGLQSKVGRTLELTGSLAAEVDAGAPQRLASVARAVIVGYGRQGELDDDAPSTVSEDQLVLWVRGVLERMRDRGAIEHKWFAKYIDNDGRRWAVGGGRPRGVGMPAFPRGRDAPGYPRVGGQAPGGSDSQKTHLDVATSAQSWFALWAKRVLGVTASDGAKLTRALFAELDKVGIVSSVPISSGLATAYRLSPSTVIVTPVSSDDRDDRRHLLECDVCHNPVPGTVQVVDQLEGAPCFAARCPGRLQRAASKGGYYRRLYDEGDMRSVVAREHTSLLDDNLRLEYENRFKASAGSPDAPNVLVATPTLEMGIDIGDLSTVMLAGLPKSVASYLQRVGRAGRLTGNALSLAFVEGRGSQLPKIGDPLSVINGQVRAPATYLNAEEILQRQYLAFLMDRMAKGIEQPPRKAKHVLSNAEEGSFLASVVTDAEAASAERLTEFVTAFDGLLSDDVLEAIRLWATPDAELGSSGLAASVYRAVQRWNDEGNLLKYRRKAIEDAMPALQKAAVHPATKDDDDVKEALRSAESALRMLGRLRGDLFDEPWIGALERFGLLPNYTLLDDSVRLDVSLSWYDEETGGWQQGTETYERGASVAISELAPGAVFYAQGLEISIDAVDLGVDGSAVERWVYCPACGFGYALNTVEQPYKLCPRCHEKGIADQAQQFDVVELSHVSAEVRRDEASIGDSRDDRQRERFTIQVAADIDPKQAKRQWHVAGTGFGITYLRSVNMRWINLGNRAAGGQPRLVAGDERPAPMFRVCAACGKLDKSSNTNSSREHRSWCRLRDAKTEQVRTVALSRTLSTQGVVLRMPPTMTVGDSLAVPSFTAAIQLGLRETIGGDPDHLRIERIVEPVAGEDMNIPALLIHDAVPGGTGYLAELAQPTSIRALFEAALTVVENCPCQHEGRAACHHCLLPYAPAGNSDAVSRASAERSLRELLGDGAGWVVVEGPAEQVETPIEVYFRKVFIDRATKLGGLVKELPGPTGNRVQVTLGRRTWMLRPQVALGPTTPDFVLEAFGGGADRIAIYADGYAFHASPKVNGIADDAAKRRAARDKEYHVLALTWGDIERADKDEPEPSVTWFSPEFAAMFTDQFNVSLSAVNRVTANPISELMLWLQDPAAAATRWASVGSALPVMAMQPEGRYISIDGKGLADSVLEAVAGGAPVAVGASDIWHVRQGPLVWASGFVDGTSATQTMLALDDSVTAVKAEGFADHWRTWLRLSNLLGSRPLTTPTAIVAVSELLAEAGVDVAAPANLTPNGASPEWEVVLSLASPSEHELLRQLASVVDISVPQLGIEVADGIPLGIAWPDALVTTNTALTDDDIADLRAAGWTVVEADLDSIRSALAATR